MGMDADSFPGVGTHPESVAATTRWGGCESSNNGEPEAYKHVCVCVFNQPTPHTDDQLTKTTPNPGSPLLGSSGDLVHAVNTT